MVVSTRTINAQPRLAYTSITRKNEIMVNSTNESCSTFGETKQGFELIIATSEGLPNINSLSMSNPIDQFHKKSKDFINPLLDG